MQISPLQKAVSFYLTGNTQLSKSVLKTERDSLFLTSQELDDMEISSHEEYKKSREESFKFKNQVLNLEADFNTVHGWFRISGLSVINSFFSGVGASFGNKINLSSGLSLAGLSAGISLFKNLPILSTKFSITGFGGNLIRGPLHILDSIFSSIGEKASKYTLPGVFAGALSLFSLNRTLNDNHNKNLELPFDTISGTLGRTAFHHVDSMLASKATSLSDGVQDLGSFLAGSLTTLGLMLPKKVRKKTIPWNNHEGFIAQGGMHFVDSLFSNIGNKFSSLVSGSKTLALGVGATALGAPVLGNLLNNFNYEIPFQSLEGKLVRGIFHAPESLVFNIGTILGNSTVGVPLSIALAGFTYFSCVSEKGKKLIKNFDVSRNKIGGLIQRLPFQLMYSLTSQAGVKISKLIPAPLMLLFGPMLSFQIGEKFKNIESKFDDVKGLLLRNSIHLWETILARSSYRAGRMITGTLDEDISSGSILSDGRWMSDDGRIVPTMAIGKQLKSCEENNLMGTVVSALSGVGLSYGAYALYKQFTRNKSNIEFQVNGAKSPPVKTLSGLPMVSSEKRKLAFGS